MVFKPTKSHQAVKCKAKASSVPQALSLSLYLAISVSCKSSTLFFTNLSTFPTFRRRISPSWNAGEMSRRKISVPVIGAYDFGVVTVIFALIVNFFVLVSAKGGSKNTSWLTLDGNAPLVIARGGFSGLFPDSSYYAYSLANTTSVPDVVLWCDVQLTKDEVGICFPNINLQNSSNVVNLYPKRQTTYNVNGVETQGYFPIDFTLRELSNLSLTQGIYTRPPDFDASGMQIQTVSDVFTQNKPRGFWLNIQYDAFYSQHKLSMRRFVLGASKSVIISHISSPEVNFLRSLARPFASTKTKLVFRFPDQGDTEPSTNQTYASLLKNLTFIKTFASGILVPKAYIWPVDTTMYLQPHTTLVADAHKIGLAVYAANFANDVTFAYNYSYNPVSEYLSFIDNGDFSVDGVLSDFPITPSEARDCFAHLGKKASGEVKPLVISHQGASGDYPACTDIAYKNAISDGADVIDCPVQMSKDRIPFCLSSVNLMNSTVVGQTQFRNRIQTVAAIQPSPGIFSFSLNWDDIKSLTPVISNPFPDYFLYRNPKFRNAGKLISLSDFLDLAKNSSVSGVLIKIENAKYLAENEGINAIEEVEAALEKAGYNSATGKKVMIQSSESSVLKELKGKKYERVYEVDEPISGAETDVIQDIKTFADSVVVIKQSVFLKNSGFLVTLTKVVSRLQSFKLQVYVQVFRNEFVTQAYDFFSDPIVEINSFVMSAKIDGVITDFPQTAATYRKNLCLKMKETPIYMSPVLPGQLFQLMSPAVMPPAEAPNPFLTVGDVTEAPLPPAVKPNATSPAPAPATTLPPPSSQDRIAASTLLCCLAMIVAALLFW